MDPPSYGRGAMAKWKIEEHLFDFVKLCFQVLRKTVVCFNKPYTTGLQPQVVNIL